VKPLRRSASRLPNHDKSAVSTRACEKKAIGWAVQTRWTGRLGKESTHREAAGGAAVGGPAAAERAWAELTADSQRRSGLCTARVAEKGVPVNVTNPHLEPGCLGAGEEVPHKDSVAPDVELEHLGRAAVHGRDFVKRGGGEGREGVPEGERGPENGSRGAQRRAEAATEGAARQARRLTSSRTLPPRSPPPPRLRNGTSDCPLWAP